MPHGKKGSKGASKKGNSSRPVLIPKGSLKALRNKVKSTKAKVNERVKAGINANRKAGARMLGKAQALRDKLEAEARRKLDLEMTLAEKDRELKELEMRLETIEKVKAAAPKGKRGKKNPSAEMGAYTGPVSINTSNDKRHEKKRVSNAARAEEVRNYKDLLEKQLIAEDEELALVKEQLAQLHEREQCLDRREDKLREVEKSLEEGACSPEMDKGIKEMREGLVERLSILEQRSKKLDMLEDELARMERFVDTQRKSIAGPKGRKKRPVKKGKPSRSRSSRKRTCEEEE